MEGPIGITMVGMALVMLVGIEIHEDPIAGTIGITNASNHTIPITVCRNMGGGNPQLGQRLIQGPAPLQLQMRSTNRSTNRNKAGTAIGPSMATREDTEEILVCGLLTVITGMDVAVHDRNNSLSGAYRIQDKVLILKRNLYVVRLLYRRALSS